MSSITMSANMANAFNVRFFGVAQLSYSGQGVYGGLLNAGQAASNYPLGMLTIMQGSVPVDFSTLTLTTSRSADVLITYSGSSFDFSGSIDDANPIVLSTVYKAASASGTATWFRWYTFGYSTTNVFNQIVGTVGVTGSGADLVLPSDNIISGNSYRIYNYRLQIPTTWTY